MKTTKLVLILSLVLLIVIIFGVYTGEKVVQQQSIPMFVKVAPYVGLAVDRDKLHFGTVPNGGSSKRSIFLYNADEYEKEVNMKIDGDISRYASISDNNFRLKSNENKSVEIKIDIPKDAENGNYTGNLSLIFKIA